MLFLETKKPKPVYKETTHRNWTVRTSGNDSIVFSPEETMRMPNTTHEDAYAKLLALLASKTASMSESKHRYRNEARINSQMRKMLGTKIGALTGVEFIKEGDRIKARILRKHVFAELKDLDVRTGGCCNFYECDGGRYTKITISKNMMRDCGLEHGVRYELSHCGDDDRGILFDVVLNSRIDPLSPTTPRKFMDRPGFVTRWFSE